MLATNHVQMSYSSKSFKWQCLFAAAVFTWVLGGSPEPEPEPEPPPPPPPPRLTAAEIYPLLAPLYSKAFIETFTSEDLKLPERTQPDPIIFVDSSDDNANIDKKIARNLADNKDNPFRHVHADLKTATDASLQLAAKGYTVRYGFVYDSTYFWNRYSFTADQHIDFRRLYPSASHLRRLQLKACFESIVLKEAEDSAKRGEIHKGNSLLSDMAQIVRTTPVSAQNVQRFFDNVANEGSVDALARNLDTYFRERLRGIIVSATHASILKRAGRDDAADFIRDAICFDIVTLLLPIVGQANKYAESYGFRSPEIDQNTLEALRGLVNAMGFEASLKTRKNQIFEALKEVGNSRQHKQYLEKLALLMKDQGDDTADIEGEDDSSSLDSLLRKINVTERSYASWLLEKSLLYELLGHVPSMAGIDAQKILAFMPLTATENSFEVFQFDRLTEEECGKVSEWTLNDFDGGDIGKLNKEQGHALLAWYLLETGESAMARSIAIIGAKEAISTSLGENLYQLGSEINGLMLALSASSVTNVPPGARPADPNSLESFGVLLDAWNKNWSRAGGEEEPASFVLDHVDRAKNRVQDELSEYSDLDRLRRYYFPDYQGKYGVIPQSFIEHVADKTELFQNSGGKTYGDLLIVLDTFSFPTKLSDFLSFSWDDSAQK